MEFLLNIRSPKGGGGHSSGGHSSSSSSSGKSGSSSSSSSSGKSGSSSSSSSSGKSGSSSSPGSKTSTIVVVTHNNGSQGTTSGLPAWVEILIIIAAIMFLIFIVAIIIFAIKEHRRKLNGQKPRLGRVIWKAFKTATLLFILIWLFEKCCGSKRKKGGSYAKIEEGQQTVQTQPQNNSSSYGVPVTPVPYAYTEGGTGYAAPTDSKYEPMTYSNAYVGTGYTPSLNSNVPHTGSMAPSPSTTPVPFIHSPPSVVPTEAPPMYAPQMQYVTPQGTGEATSYSAPPPTEKAP